MPLDTCFEKVIPGISMVSEVELQCFFDSAEGRELLSQALAGEFNQQLIFTDIVSIRRIHNAERVRRAQINLSRTDSFIRLKKSILKAMLSRWIFDFKFIDPALQDQLLEREYTTRFYESYFVNNQSLNVCIQNWYSSFCSDEQEESRRALEQVCQAQEEFLADVREKIGFLLVNSANTEHEKTTLIYDIAKLLYYSNQSKDNKKKLLKEHFKKYLKQHERCAESETFSLLNLSRYALSYLINQKDLTSITEYLNRIADAHTFYQFLGLSTENGGWELDYLDLYNYARNEQGIATLKTILYAFLRPVHSFFHEYVQIATYEKNTVNLVFRAIMPITVMTCCLVFSFSIIVSFAMHALIETFMLIPALYFGMVVASAYVDLKNTLHNWVIISRYGDFYLCEQFQVNERILTGFDTNPVLAQAVADYYTSNLKECDAIDNRLSKKLAKGTLTTKELEQHRLNIERKSTLLLEWYDIHENHMLGVDEIKDIVSNRLKKDGAEAYKEIKTEHEVYISGLIDELEQHLASSQPAARSPDPRMRWSLFKPKEPVQQLGHDCVRRQQKIEAVERLQPMISYSMC